MLKWQSRVLCIALFCSSQGGFAKELVGILELPKLNPLKRPGSFKPTPIKLYEKPSLDSAADTAVEESGLSSIPYRKFDWILVSRRQGDFYEVDYAGQPRWIHKRDWGKYWSYEQILKTNSGKIIASRWDGKVYKSPNGEFTTVEITPDEYGTGRAIKILEMKVVDGQTWVKVKLFGEVCAPFDEKSPVKTGWIPTHNEKQELLVWIAGLC